jgi:hypothetical protein
MTPPPAAVERYLDRNAIQGRWQLAGEVRAGFAGAIVIPSLAEGDRLFTTLQSLAGNPAQWTAHFLVVVVINQGAAAEAGQQRQNVLDLARLAGLGVRSKLCLAWVDAASPGCEVPDRLAGVGFARKLGMDLALERLDWSGDPLLICLDADTLVEAGYLQAIASHFRHSTLGAAVLPFRHQPGAGPAQQAAIDRYELFLRSYVYGLHLAGSPYAFNSVGSAMACRGSAYVRCGGMNCRKAGEDFYFLQKLAKTDGVGRLAGTTVFPEPRVSERVPFGTGRSMARLLAGEARAVLFYPAAAFRIIAEWLQVAGENLSGPAEQVFAQAETISPVLAGYLDQSGWHTIWPRLQSTHNSSPKRLQAFHAWFDGFRTMRLLHLLCDDGLQRGEPAEVLPEYFAWGGHRCPSTVAEMLEALRLLDGTAP